MTKRTSLSRSRCTILGGTGNLVESRRHKQFKAERIGRRENFNPSPALLAHIEAIREEHGEPNITTWPKLHKTA